MPRNLDDFELERTPFTPPDEPGPEREREPRAQPPEPPRPEPAARQVDAEPPRPPLSEEVEIRPPETRLGGGPLEQPGGGRTLPLILALVALLAFGLLGVFFFVFRQPAKPQAARTQPPVTAPASPAASASPVETGPVPPLEESDDFVRSVAAGLSPGPEVARWLARRDLVRTLTAVVLNVVDGETPRPHLEFLAPAQRFRVKGGPGGRIVADPASFAGYDRFAEAVSSVDTEKAVSSYRRLEPLFEAAYRELGHPEGGFRQAVDRGIAALLTAPVPPADAELVPHAIGFRWKDPRLEGLTPAQKQFLRTGPRNVKLIQAKLREVRTALGTAQAPPADRGR